MSSTSVSIEISPGELIDKITILIIKSERVEGAAKLANVRVELALLDSARASQITLSPELVALEKELKSINETLWVIEDDIRDCERAKDFGNRFVELARAVYRTNDERSRIKREINELLGSVIVEEKSYQPY